MQGRCCRKMKGREGTKHQQEEKSIQAEQMPEERKGHVKRICWKNTMPNT